MTRLSLPLVVEQLKAHYGSQRPHKLNGPWEMILWENVAYLATDQKRREAFEMLKVHVGTKPEQILSASEEALLLVTSHGILADQFAAKLRKCAKILLEEFDGDLDEAVKWPLAKARKALQKFPGIGEPGAEKILLFSRRQYVLPLESNGLRVLVRLGFAKEQKSYSKTYGLVQKAIADGLNDNYPWLIQAHMLLRHHGQELCKRAKPMCESCPLAELCEFHLQANA